MRKFTFGMLALAAVAALAGSAEARERRFLFFRYDDGRNYSQPMNYQPAPQQQAQTPPAVPPAQEAVQAPAQPAAQPVVQAPATQPAQPLAVQQPMTQQPQQQQYYYNNGNYNRSNGGFFDGLMEFERRKNAWLFGR